MSKTLYEEAVADAQKLRELAEETAKNRVIEAVMPQIRDLVNKRILGENLEDLPDSMVDTHDDHGHHDMSIDNASDEKEEAEESAETNIEIEAEGDVNINLAPQEDDEDSLVLDKRMSEALKSLIKGNTLNENSEIENKLSDLETKVKKLSEVLDSLNSRELDSSQQKRLNLSYLHCVREAIKLRSMVIITEGKTQERLERRLTNTIKEIKKMSKSNRRNIFDFLFEDEERKSMEELEEAELSLELTDDEQEELAGADDADAVSDALEDILADLEVSMDAPDADDAGGDEGAEEDEAEGEDDPGAEEEIDLGEADKMEGEYKEGSYAEGDMDEVYEIDESMLRRELAKMMTEDAAEEADQYGGGEALGDVLLDIDEEDLINVLADEIGNTDVPATPPMVAVESRRRASRRRAVNRQLAETRRENNQYKTAVKNLKSQLVEMNLFNAKLLYANKLMQNKNLTMKQQKAIVEALDNAKTLREAKLLYKSLTESLNRKSSKKLTEGSLRTLGSSSRSTRSAQPATNGVEVDRWGVLAGLHSKD